MGVDDELLNDYAAADVCGVKVATLRAWRLQGEGPPYLKVGKRLVRYVRGDVLRWLAAQRVETKATVSAV